MVKRFITFGLGPKVYRSSRYVSAIFKKGETVMHWILQNNIFSEEGWNTLIDTCERFNLSYSEHKVVPFVGELLPEPKLDHKNVICIGSYSMRHIAKHYGWNPGVFDLIEQDFEKQVLHWGKYMLNADSVVTQFKDVRFPYLEMFVRPTDDSKYFSGRIFSFAEFEQWQRLVCELHEDHGTSLTPETMVQVIIPKEILAEYRFWIVKGEIITSSLYKRGDKVIYLKDVDPAFADFVQKRIEEWMPCETFVIDVCDTPEGIKIVEINTMNSSGFYAADVQKLVLTLEEEYSKGE
jgi:hypothetical protein